jgi:hypothetical protein
MMIRKLLLGLMFLVGVCGAADVKFYYSMGLNSNIPLFGKLDGMLVMMPGDDVTAADDVDVTVMYTLNGKSATVTKTVGRPDAFSAPNLLFPKGLMTIGPWFNLCDYGDLGEVVIKSISVSERRGDVISGKTVISPQVSVIY